MSFRFDWSVFAKSTLPGQIRERINEYLSASASETSAVAGKLAEIDFGSEEPDLKLIEVDELRNDEMRLQFSFSYAGNASLRMELLAQVNPLVSENKCGAAGRRHMGVLAAAQPLRIRLDIRLSEFRLEGRLLLTYTANRRSATVHVQAPVLQSVRIESNMDGSGAGPQVADKIRSKLQAAISSLALSPMKIAMPGK